MTSDQEQVTKGAVNKAIEEIEGYNFIIGQLKKTGIRGHGIYLYYDDVKNAIDTLEPVPVCRDVVSRKAILDKIKELCPGSLSTQMAALRLFVKHTPASQEPGETKEKPEEK